MTEAPRGRGRRQFLLIALVFFAPLIAAYLYYFAFPEWQPTEKTHHGVLVNPARPVPELKLRDAQGQPLTETALKGKWSLLYVSGSECAKSCQDKLFQIRQIRTLLNHNRDRVQRVFAAQNAGALAAARAVLEPQHPDLIYLDAHNSGLREFLQPQEPDAIYLLDPLGNWLMSYPAASEYQGILKDVKKLLRLSQIG